MSEMMETFSVKYVSTTLGIVESTVRKHCNILEGYGYVISRNENNARIFYNHDIASLRKLLEESSKGRKLDDIAMEIAGRQVEHEKIKGNPPAPSDAALIRTLINKVEQLTIEVKELREENEDGRRLLQMNLHKIEQKLELSEPVVEVEEVKEEVATTVEEVKEEKTKKGLFARIFNK